MIAIRRAANLVDAGPLLARALRFDTGGTGGQVDDLVRGCLVFELLDGDCVVGAFAVQAADYSDGRVLTVTAAGGLPGFDLVGAMDAWMTLQAAGPAGARALTCTTRRPGLVRKLQKAGYHVAGYVLRKDVKYGIT